MQWTFAWNMERVHRSDEIEGDPWFESRCCRISKFLGSFDFDWLLKGAKVNDQVKGKQVDVEVTWRMGSGRREALQGGSPTSPSSPTDRVLASSRRLQFTLRL